MAFQLVAGYASYQESKYFVGPNRDHIVNDRDVFYKNEPNECYPVANAKMQPTSIARKV